MCECDDRSLRRVLRTVCDESRRSRLRHRAARRSSKRSPRSDPGGTPGARRTVAAARPRPQRSQTEVTLSARDCLYAVAIGVVALGLYVATLQPDFGGPED